MNWPIVAAHLSVLPDGRVITWTSTDIRGDPHAVHAWNPATGTFTDLSQGVHDVFCAAQTFLADGRMLLAGGHIADNKGLKHAAAFNWQTDSWDPIPSMRAGRWYPTATTLISGAVTVVAGSDENASGNNLPEVWDGTAWRELPGASLAMPYYPWMHSAPDGRVFNSGPDQVTRFLNPVAGGEWKLGPRSNGGYRDYGGSIMYAPGKILVMGGGDPPTNTAETIDLNTGGGWQFTGSMSYARRQMNATILPDGKVLALGGTSGAGFNDESRAVLAAESWNPATGTWSTLASMQVARIYHSSAVLLPDARVLIAGGGRCADCRIDHLDAQTFSPPYLFNADGTAATRPQITSAPTQVNYGATLAVQTPNAASITRVTWVRLPATTHSFNQNQWFNDLSFTATSNGLSVTAPATAYLAPPGHYMLFILNANGVPSAAKIVKLVGTASLPPAPGIPTAPTSLVAGVLDSEQTRLLWTDASTSETAFRIERCQGSGCANFAEVAQVAGNVTYYKDTELAAGTTYSYRVRAQNNAGLSGYTNVSTTTTLAAGSAPSPGPLLHRASGLCLDVRNGAQADDGDHVLLAPCNGSSSQQWSIPATGALGDVLVFGRKCLDAWTGQGNDGDAINVYACHGGVNQQWGLSAGGELKGGFGKCLVPTTSPAAAGTEFVLGACTGVTAQKWVSNPGSDLPPIADFTVTCSGVSCTFNSSTSSDDRGIASRAWNFGDGDSAGDLVTPLKSYTTTGTFTVTLTVTDAAGQTDVKTRSVVVAVSSNSPPTATFTSSCTGLTCTFADGSSDADGSVQAWSWNFGDGATATQRNPSHTYAAAGSYTVTLTVTDNGSAPGSTTRSVTVAAAPGTRLPPGPLVNSSSGLCLDLVGGSQNEGARVTLAACNGTRGQQWSIMSGGALGETLVYGWACLDAYSGQGRDGDAIVMWTCHGGPNQQWALTATGELRGALGKCVIPATLPVGAGTQWVLGTCDGRAALKFTNGTAVPNRAPTAAFTSSCTGLICSFTDGSSDADGTVQIWNWAFGDGAVSPARSPAHTFPASGSYTVTLTVQDDDGTTGTTSRSVTVSGAPPPRPPAAAVANSATGLCLATSNASQAEGTRTVLATCTGAAGQRWAMPAAGTFGEVRAAGSLCLDAYSGQGRDGDAIVIWTCHGGPNQQWSLTATGEIKTALDKCIVPAALPTGAGTQWVLGTCTGAAAQRWAMGTP